MGNAVLLQTRRADSASDDVQAVGEEPPASCEPHPSTGNSGSENPRALPEVTDGMGTLAPGVISRLRDRIAAALDLLNASGDVRVRLVGDADMADAHMRHMNQPGTTDVITFDLAEGRAASGDPLDVDLLICVDEAGRQAARRGIDIERELLLYAVHGLLHCLGHDDIDEQGAAAMHLIEDKTLTAMGLGPVFAVDECGTEN